MKRKSLWIALAAAALALTVVLLPGKGGRDAQTMARLSGALDRRLSGEGGKWAVYVEDLATGASARAEHGAACDEKMISASLIKLFIMTKCFAGIEDGTLREADVWPDLYQMITVSDNDAANRLVRLLGGGDAGAGMAAVNAWCAEAGFRSCAMERLMLEENGKQNYVSVLDCARLLRAIFEGKCVSAAASEKMLSVLKDQKWDDYIPQGPPRGTVIAHKDGDLRWLCHGDVGIVYDAEGAYIECILCNEPASDEAAIRALPAVAQLVDRYMGGIKWERRCLAVLVLLTGAILAAACSEGKRKK